MYKIHHDSDALMGVVVELLYIDLVSCPVSTRLGHEAGADYAKLLDSNGV